MNYLVFISTVFLLLSCSTKTQKNLYADLNQSKTRFEALETIKQISEKKFGSVEDVNHANDLISFAKKHPHWIGIEITKQLKKLHHFSPKLIESHFISFLKAYPQQGYYPPRDDAMAILMVSSLTKWSHENKKLAQTLSKVLNTIVLRITIEDPNSKLRETIAGVLLDLGKSHNIRETLRYLLSNKKDQHYRVNKAAAKSLGSLGISEIDTVIPLVKSLFIIKNGISAASEAAYALSLTKGKAKTKTESILFRLVKDSMDILSKHKNCDDVFKGDESSLCTLYKDALKMGWLKNDPILFENTGIKILSYMKSVNKIEQLSSMWSKDALMKRWNKKLALFSEKSGQEIKIYKDMSRLVLQKSSIAGFDKDVSIRGEILAGCSMLNACRTEIFNSMGFGEWTNLVMSDCEAGSNYIPDEFSRSQFIKTVKSVRCGATSSIFYSILRSTALNTVLEDPKLSSKLSAAWNKESTSDKQWSSTRKFWQPVLLKEAGGFTKCKGGESTFCLLPDERLRFEVLKMAWYHADPKMVPALLQLKPEDLIFKPAAKKEDSPSGDMIVSIPWDKNAEQLRQKTALKYLEKEMIKLREIADLLNICANNIKCYTTFIEKGKIKNLKINPLLKAKAGRMAIILSREIPGEIVDIYTKLGSRERGLFLNFLSRSDINSRYKIFRKLSKINKKFRKLGIDFINTMRFDIIKSQKTP